MSCMLKNISFSQVLICACDTFRAGAVEQLKTHSRYSEFAGFDEFSLERYVAHRYSSVMGAGAWMCHFLNVAMGRSRVFLLCITSK